MVSELGVPSFEHGGASKRAPRNAIFVGAVLLAILTMVMLLAVGVRLGTIDPAIKDTVLSGAGASPALWGFVALIFGCCVCARRDCGRNRGDATGSGRRPDLFSRL